MREASASVTGILRRLTIERTMIAATFVVVFMFGAQLRIDTDVWWHLRAGAYTLHHGIIRQDPFSFTQAGQDWIDHSWAAEVVLHGLWRAGGYGALEVLTGLLALTGAVCVYRMSPGGTYLRCVLTGLAALTASIFWAPRPQMFSFALTAVVLYILFLRRFRDLDLLWTLPLVMLLWANLHGAFVIGLGLMGVTLVGELLERRLPLDERGALEAPALRKLAVVLALSLAAVCINPYGPRLLRVPLETGSGAFSSLIQEWMPPDFHSYSYWPLALMIVLFVLSVGASPRRLGWSDGLLSVGAVLLAITAGRNISIFAVVVTPVVAYHLHAALEERRILVRSSNTASLPVALANLAIVLAVVGVSAGRLSPAFVDSRLDDRMAETFPVGAVEYLQAHGTRGPLFNSYDWGGYVMFTLPRVPVFVDGRSDLYGSAFLENPYRYIAGGGPDWDLLLDRYEIGTVLIPRTAGLAAVIARSGTWRWVYSDDVAFIFERRQAPA